MALTTAGALKAWIEGAGLGVAVFRDTAPTGQTYPYVTVQEGISVAPDASGDNGQNATVREQVQVDLWQTIEGEKTSTTADQLTQRLHGAHLPAGRTHVYGVTVDFTVRRVDRDTKTVNHAITCSVRRDL